MNKLVNENRAVYLYYCYLCHKNLSASDKCRYCRVYSLEAGYSCGRCSKRFSTGYVRKTPYEMRGDRSAASKCTEDAKSEQESTYKILHNKMCADSVHCCLASTEKVGSINELYNADISDERSAGDVKKDSVNICKKSKNSSYAESVQDYNASIDKLWSMNKSCSLDISVESKCAGVVKNDRENTFEKSADTMFDVSVRNNLVNSNDMSSINKSDIVDISDEIKFTEDVQNRYGKNRKKSKNNTYAESVQNNNVSTDRIWTMSKSYGVDISDESKLSGDVKNDHENNFEKSMNIMFDESVQNYLANSNAMPSINKSDIVDISDEIKFTEDVQKHYGITHIKSKNFYSNTKKIWSMNMSSYVDILAESKFTDVQKHYGKTLKKSKNRTYVEGVQYYHASSDNIWSMNKSCNVDISVESKFSGDAKNNQEITFEKSANVMFDESIQNYLANSNAMSPIHKSDIVDISDEIKSTRGMQKHGGNTNKKSKNCTYAESVQDFHANTDKIWSKNKSCYVDISDENKFARDVLKDQKNTSRKPKFTTECAKNYYANTDNILLSNVPMDKSHESKCTENIQKGLENACKKPKITTCSESVQNYLANTDKIHVCNLCRKYTEDILEKHGNNCKLLKKSIRYDESVYNYLPNIDCIDKLLEDVEPDVGVVKEENVRFDKISEGNLKSEGVKYNT